LTHTSNHVQGSTDPNDNSTESSSIVCMEIQLTHTSNHVQRSPDPNDNSTESSSIVCMEIQLTHTSNHVQGSTDPNDNLTESSSTVLTEIPRQTTFEDQEIQKQSFDGINPAYNAWRFNLHARQKRLKIKRSTNDVSTHQTTFEDQEIQTTFRRNQYSTVRTHGDSTTNMFKD
jgi:hypothetical protein